MIFCKATHFLTENKQASLKFMLFLFSPWPRSSLICFSNIKEKLRLILWCHHAGPLARVIPTNSWTNCPVLHTNIIFIYDQRYLVLVTDNVFEQNISPSLTPLISSLLRYFK